VDEPFTKQQIGELIGKAALFEVRFWLEDGFANEKISFKGEVPEGMAVPEIDESVLYYINLDGENDESAVKQLRKSIKNTIKNSVSYQGSKLQEQFGDLIEGKQYTKPEDKVEEATADVDSDSVSDSPPFDDSDPF
jgi:hypothetical protein